MARGARQVARVRHVPRRQGGADPVRGLVAHRTIAGGHTRIAARDVVGRQPLQSVPASIGRCGGASGVDLVGEMPEIDIGTYGAGTPAKVCPAWHMRQLLTDSPLCSVGMLAASTAQVSAGGLLPWHTPQSINEGIGGT